MIDERNYAVTGINGFRQGNLTRNQAIALARRMQQQMKEAGWRGRMKIFYRDGSPVAWEEEQCHIDLE